MKYMSIKDAAIKWGVSERMVQQLCSAGRVKGAVKFGNAWAVPEKARKPEDPRRAPHEPPRRAPRKKLTAGAEASPDMRLAMPLLNTAFAPGSAIATIEAMPDEDTRHIAYAEYYYFSGQARKSANIAERYLNHGDFSLRISAYWLYAFANLALNQTEKTMQVIELVQQLYGTIDEATPLAHRAVAVCLYHAVLTQLHLLKPADLPLAQDFVHILPPGLRLFVLYVQARYAYTHHLHGTGVGVAETGLVTEDTVYPIPTIYLHIACAMNYMLLARADLAEAHLLAAWELARPDDIIGPFCELHGLLSGALETVVKKKHPEDFRRMLTVADRHAVGWCRIHNTLSGEQLPTDLSATEFIVSTLAAGGCDNREIADRLGMTEYTARHHMTSALQKMGISDRKDLKRIMQILLEEKSS